jgi:hypothetical protein
MYDTTRNTPLKVLEVAASGRNDGSVSRMLSADLIGALEERHGTVALTRRDLNKGLPFVDDAWINANFTAPEERSAGQRAALAESDALVAELKAADVLVIGSPIYNFGVPRVHGLRFVTRRPVRRDCSKARKPTWSSPPAVSPSIARWTSRRRTSGMRSHSSASRTSK